MPIRQEPPHAWRADDLRNEANWKQPLSKVASQGLRDALFHALNTQKDLLALTQDDFPLNGAALEELRQAVDATQTRFGLRLLCGLPLDGLTVDQVVAMFWGIGLHIGVARTQGRDSHIISHVRDEGGGGYRKKGGRGYNTNAELDFHSDFCDLVGLLCLHKAMHGGESYLVSSIAVYDEIKRRRPDLLKILCEPLHYSFQGAQAPGDGEYFTCPIFGFRDGRFASRSNRKNVTAAHADFPEIGKLSDMQIEALDLYEEVVRMPELCFSMSFEPGDAQFLNNHVILHSRNEFEDWPEPELRRHLLRLWLALPQGQALPEGWMSGYKAIEPASVRGGLRGSKVSSEFLRYEKRQAGQFGMRLPTRF